MPSKSSRHRSLDPLFRSRVNRVLHIHAYMHACICMHVYPRRIHAYMLAYMHTCLYACIQPTSQPASQSAGQPASQKSRNPALPCHAYHAMPSMPSIIHVHVVVLYKTTECKYHAIAFYRRTTVRGSQPAKRRRSTIVIGIRSNSDSNSNSKIN